MTDTITSSKANKRPNEYRTLAAEKARKAGYVCRDIKQRGKYDDCMAYLNDDVWPVTWGEPKPNKQSKHVDYIADDSTAIISDCREENLQQHVKLRDKVRVRYVRFYFDDFFGDRRVQMLEPQQRQQWLYLLACMMRNGGSIADNPVIVGNELAISHTSAKALITRLVNISLLVRGGSGDLFVLESPRLTKEYSASIAALETQRERASQGGRAKAAKYKGTG